MKKFIPSPEYLARQKRIDDAMQLAKPDRIPVVPVNYTYYPTRVKGISNKEAMEDLVKRFQIWKESIVDYDWDAAPPPWALHSSCQLKNLGAKQIKWPGGGLTDDQPFQWVEGEYMYQEEYDEVLADPAGFAIKKLWPRISSFLEPISALANNTPPALLLSLSNPYALPGFLGQLFSSPPMSSFLQKAQELAKTHKKNEMAYANYYTEMMELGYPFVIGPGVITAFDMVSDMLRGMKGSMLDMFRASDKLLALVELFIPFTIEGAVLQARQMGIKGIWIALHRGAAGFMSDKQFAKFYWPSLKALLFGLIDAGLTPIPYFEGDYTPRLEYLQDLPPKKILPHWDIVDRKKVKKMLGDRFCFWGNVPASIMCTGTPQDVRSDVRQLIDIFGDKGGLIVDSIPGIPDEAKPENVRALVEAVHEYGSL